MPTCGAAQCPLWAAHKAPSFRWSPSNVNTAHVPADLMATFLPPQCFPPNVLLPASACPHPECPQAFPDSQPEVTALLLVCLPLNLVICKASGTSRLNQRPLTGQSLMPCYSHRPVWGGPSLDVPYLLLGSDVPKGPLSLPTTG